MPGGQFQSWDFDAPSGVYKSHALADRIMRAVVPQLQFNMFMPSIGGYGKNRGDTVTVPRFSNMSVPSNPRFGEFDDVPEDVVSQSTTSTTVSQWGRILPYSQFNADLSPLDLPAELRRTLERQMMLSVERAAASKLQTGLSIYIPTSASGGTFDTDGTASTPATNNLSFDHLEEMRDYLAADLNAEPFPDGNFVALLSTKAIRGLKDDPKFATWNAPQNREAKVRGEVGIIEGIRIIEVNDQGSSAEARSFRDDLGTGSVLGGGIVFGRDPGYSAVVRDFEMRVAKLDPMGLKHGIMWYGIREYGLFWDADSATIGEARILRLGSS